MTTKKAILYARFSPRPNAKECDSIEKQLEELREYCNKRNIEIMGEFDDPEVSGADDYKDRKGMFEAENACKRGYIFLVRDFDRLFRNTIKALTFVEYLQKRGVTVTSINQESANDQSPEGKLIRAILLAIAEYMREITKIRTSMGMKRNQRNGLRMSSKPPYGTQINPDDPERLIPHPDEQNAIQAILERYSECNSYNAVATYLNEQAIYNRSGKEWHHEQIKRIVQRENS